MTQPIYVSIMGEKFNKLAPSIKVFHNSKGKTIFTGSVKVNKPASLLACILAMSIGAPLKEADGAIKLEILTTDNTETWIRFFPGKAMKSVLTKSGTHLVEKLGASRLVFELLEISGSLETKLIKLYFLGIPCPNGLMPKIEAIEHGAENKVYFKVKASMPIVGVVACYTGYLDISNEVL